MVKSLLKALGKGLFQTPSTSFWKFPGRGGLIPVFTWHSPCACLSLCPNFCYL